MAKKLIFGNGEAYIVCLSPLNSRTLNTYSEPPLIHIAEETLDQEILSALKTNNKDSIQIFAINKIPVKIKPVIIKE